MWYLKCFLTIPLLVDIGITKLLAKLKDEKMQDKETFCFWNKWDWKYNRNQFQGSLAGFCSQVFQMGLSLLRTLEVYSLLHKQTKQGGTDCSDISKPPESISSSGFRTLHLRRGLEIWDSCNRMWKDHPRSPVFLFYRSTNKSEAHSFFSFFFQVPASSQFNSPSPRWMKLPLSRSEILGLCYTRVKVSD